MVTTTRFSVGLNGLSPSNWSSQINAIQCRELRSILSAISFASVVYSRSFENENENEYEVEIENRIEDRTSLEMRSRTQTKDI